ncbi:MAG TPA: M20/M25/M40 family metallo-hydrolase [Bacteroidales bacterium]|nr:M20/M25/M40 family metallo-hydrolase [Bacteroidales bacterium]
MTNNKITKTNRNIFSAIIVLSLLAYSCGRTNNPEVTTDELLSHIKYLSSDSLRGRMTGSAGDSLAAVYIRDELVSYSLSPLTGDGFQRFEVARRVVAGKDNTLSINENDYAPDKDFVPFAFSSNTGLESEVIFAGYGFNINNDSLKWNDYKGLDIKGKWVMILRADPETDNNRSPFIPFSGDRDKALLAKDMGAAGVLMVSGPAFDPLDTFESLNAGDFSVDIPVFRIKNEVADIILSKSKITIATLEKNLNETRRPNSFSTSVTLNGKAEIVRENANTRNVVMILPGEDELLKDEYIIIGAHFDHLGMGGPGSSSRAVDTIGVHHGADDNASGVAMMLELAEKFARTKGSHKRSIICIAFSGEELGLLGSKYFAENPGIDLTKVNAMINLDMVGRLQETNILQISGVGTAEGFKDIVYSTSDTTLIKLTLSDEGYGPSDHSSFYGKNIPVLFYTTGAHLDYHTPFDTYDKINYEGMVNISLPIYSIISILASATDKLQFRESGPKAETGRYMRRKGVTLGIMPDFAGNIKNGLRADFVTPGKPAALGGMKKGDIITSINGKTVNNIQDYMFRMGQLKHGETISVEVKRNDKNEVLLIQL